MRAGSASQRGGLTQGQLDVVRLVAEHRSSKEIARELGISPNTVDQRLKRVQAILGVASRFEAARLWSAGLLNDTEPSTNLCGDLVYQRSTLPVEPGRPDKAMSSVEPDPVGDTGRELHLSRAAYDAGSVSWRHESWYAGLLEAGRRNDLTPLARTVAIGAITLAGLLSVAIIVVVAEGLSRLV